MKPLIAFLAASVMLITLTALTFETIQGPGTERITVPFQQEEDILLDHAGQNSIRVRPIPEGKRTIHRSGNGTAWYTNEQGSRVYLFLD